MKINLHDRRTQLVGSVVVFAIIVGIVSLSLSAKSPPTQASANAANDPPPMPVAALRLTTSIATVYEALPGRVVAYQTAEIRPQVGGILKDLLFVEGSYVEEGAPLYQIDSAPYEAYYRSALASVEKANANLLSLEVTNKRFNKLIKTNAVSQQEYDDNQVRYAQAQADLGIARAAMAQAKINLEFTKVEAPISGKIGKSQLTKGALLNANQSALLATITQMHPIYVDMSLPSSSLSYLRNELGSIDNIPVVIFADAEQKNISHRGVLKFHEVTVDPSTSSVQLRAEFPNENASLLPGLFVRAALQLELSDVMLVPQQAAQRQPDGSLAVWVVGDDGSVNLTNFVEQRALGDQWIVGSGLNNNDVIVTQGMMKLQPGAKVAPAFAADNLPKKTAQANVNSSSNAGKQE